MSRALHQLAGFTLFFGTTVIIDKYFFVTCRYVEDGWGYGAGGGENYRSGYNGVAVFIICK